MRESLFGADETTHGKCPKCGISFDGDDIPERMRQNYSPPYKWDKLIGIEVSEKFDGVSYWKCPGCGTVWDRFTNEEREDLKNKWTNTVEKIKNRHIST